MEKEELLRLFISLDFVTINPVVIIGYTIIILGEVYMEHTNFFDFTDFFTLLTGSMNPGFSNEEVFEHLLAKLYRDANRIPGSLKDEVSDLLCKRKPFHSSVRKLATIALVNDIVTDLTENSRILKWIIEPQAFIDKVIYRMSQDDLFFNADDVQLLEANRNNLAYIVSYVLIRTVATSNEAKKLRHTADFNPFAEYSLPTPLMQHSLVSHYPKSNDSIFGRDADFEYIKNELNQYGHVILCGDGGIGKTKLATGFCMKYSEHYDNIAFITYNGDVADLLLQLSFSDDDTFIGNAYERCKRNEDRLHYLTKKTLIVIDNYDVLPENDDILYKFFNDSFHLIVTTRIRYDNAYEVTPISVDSLLELFKYHYKADIPLTDEEENALTSVFEHLDRHTLLIELLARAAYFHKMQRAYGLLSFLE